MMKRTIGKFIALTVILLPSLAQAHSAGHSVSGWQDGFNHPLHGWDHLLAMSIVTFATGFIAATLLLHGTGLMATRAVCFALAFFVGGSAVAQQATNTPAAKAP